MSRIEEELILRQEQAINNSRGRSGLLQDQLNALEADKQAARAAANAARTTVPPVPINTATPNTPVSTPGDYSSYFTTPGNSSEDHRVRIRARPGKETDIYGPTTSSAPMSILHKTRGVVFPYTPTIQDNQNIQYSEATMVHSNQDFHYYARTPSVKFNISGYFTAQNQWEARYCLGVMHFFKTVSKMRFGEKDPQRGLPPPILILEGYGDYMLNSLPVILSAFTIDLQPTVDYMPVDLAYNINDFGAESGLTGDTVITNPKSSYAYVPTYFNISASLIVQNTPNRLRKEFTLDQFRNGSLLGATKGFY